jgi:hypothetical protein
MQKNVEDSVSIRKFEYLSWRFPGVQRLDATLNLFNLAADHIVNECSSLLA